MDFSKKGVEKKQKPLVSTLPRNKRKLSVSLFKTLLVIFLAIVVLGIGSGFGMLKGILDDTPEVNAKDLIPVLQAEKPQSAVIAAAVSVGKKCGKLFGRNLWLFICRYFQVAICLIIGDLCAGNSFDLLQLSQ